MVILGVQGVSWAALRTLVLRVERRIGDAGPPYNFASEGCAEIAANFRADPKLAAFLDPAVHVEVDNEGHVTHKFVERLQLIKVMSNMESTDGRQFTNESPEGLPIAVFVIDKDKSSATLFRAPDPRTAPNVWPWTGREDDEV